ncbi:hypothetical protein [Coraliomargarita akajimensis]|uniref:Uncharacterized protein n=1 Tax=Coraliomargarita akajimensis (strain DSM 45221 / IAM 15411 / JCM 23193 / KCTC 12865 / 04OKA010-24) TaxID=583355 RepID=D5EPR2_CORAD|nr:hypothetical protein [Coraliomargarita akajimensis]ADE55645.1 hypothetical protein Caka_2629 [Coraliomargarita akajimensis DSM 45221]
MRTITRVFATHALIALLVGTQTGCTYSKKSFSPTLDRSTSGLAPQETTRTEVLDQLGPPLKISYMPGGYAFLYESLDIEELQFGIQLPLLRWFKLVLANADYQHHVKVFQFDNEHRLVTVAEDTGSFDLGSSSGIQPIVTVQSLFNTEFIESDVVDLTEWGQYNLQTPAITLNRAQSLDMGTSGFEQRGTAPITGQRANEGHKKLK